ncbi:uncharacterized protein [Periplaneta americana]|uniref:uncharacterized protein n=1 Tax=Periplaneta americana TaxID=6978 RepID=UPI0037E88509
MSISDVKLYLTPKICRENVRELDLSSCYWVPAADIMSIVKKLPKLHAVYAVDTQLNWTHILKIVKLLRELKRLSWSWQSIVTPTLLFRMCRGALSVAYALDKLQFQLLHLKTEHLSIHDVNVLCTWVGLCKNLEELWVLAPAQTAGVNYCVEQAASHHILAFPQLHTLVLSLSDHKNSSPALHSFFSAILQGCKTRDMWRCCWVPKSRIGCQMPSLPHARALMVTRGTIGAIPQDCGTMPHDCPKLEHLGFAEVSLTQKLEFPTPFLKKLYLSQILGSVDWNFLWDSVSGLEELNISMCVSNITTISVQQQMRRLSLPICIFKEPGNTPNSVASISNRTVWVIVETCPNLEVFELVPCSSCIYRPTSVAQETSFLLFSKLKQLRRLKLAGLECFLTGKPLIQICKMCEQLESISLQNLGLSGKCNYLQSLCQALELCKNLKEFRLEQPNIMQLERLFSVLEGCHSLERLCILSARESKLSSPSILVNLVLSLPRLIFFSLRMDSLTAHARKVMCDAIEKQCKTLRPALHVTGGKASMHMDNVRHLPAIHYFEMMEDMSRVCIMPGSGPHYLPHA